MWSSYRRLYCMCHGKIKMTNVWVLDQDWNRLFTIRRGIMERKLKYFGHIVRRSEGVWDSKYCKVRSRLELTGSPRSSTLYLKTDDIKKVSGQGMKGATQMAQAKELIHGVLSWRFTTALYSAMFSEVWWWWCISIAYIHRILSLFKYAVIVTSFVSARVVCFREGNNKLDTMRIQSWFNFMSSRGDVLGI